MGLLGGTAGYPVSQTSGTAFYAFGLAWGINEGVLDRETCEPTVLRAWGALSDAVTEEGLLGYVQPVGAAPGDSFPDYAEVYGVGAFLAAGSEIHKMLKAYSPQAAPSLAGVRVMMYNGGWCWFQDPRALIHDDKVIVGGVAGNGRGDVAIGVCDLTENKHHHRISDRADYRIWGREQAIDRDHPVTYMNLLELRDENTLYNFYRGIDWNPSFVTSVDNGESWSKARQFIQSDAVEEGYDAVKREAGELADAAEDTADDVAGATEKAVKDMTN